MKEQLRQTQEQRQEEHSTACSTPTKRDAVTNLSDTKDNVPMTNETTNREAEIASVNELLAIIAGTQQRIVKCVLTSTRPLEVHSTIDTSSVVTLYNGDRDKRFWLAWRGQLRRLPCTLDVIPHHAKCIDSTRGGAAKDWQTAYGKSIRDWETWKQALLERFRRNARLPRIPVPMKHWCNTSTPRMPCCRSRRTN